MKKVIILIIISVFLTACNIAHSKNEQNTPEEYYLTINDIDIKPNMFFNTVKSLLGPFNDYRYDDNQDIVFEYNGFEILTYSDNNTEKVKRIRITNEEIKTNEGLKIGDPEELIPNIYGKNYKIDGNKINYKLNNTYLSFTIENGIIIEVDYYN